MGSDSTADPMRATERCPSVFGAKCVAGLSRNIKYFFKFSVKHFSTVCSGLRLFHRRNK